MEIVTG